MHTQIVLALAIVAVAASSSTDPNGQRIVGGSVTIIDAYPTMAALLVSWGTVGYTQSCGGSILNNRSIMSAAHCTYGLPAMASNVVRLGSSFGNSGGTIYNIALFIHHPNYNTPVFMENDISILRLTSTIIFSNVVQPASIAGPNYNLADNEVVWAAGWGRIYEDGPTSEQLRHVQIWTVNQATCRNNYAALGATVTDNMLCAGWLGVGGRGQCSMDSGSPLYHQGVVVGVCSFSSGCARPNHPAVNIRVSRYTAWIQANA